MFNIFIFTEKRKLLKELNGLKSTVLLHKSIFNFNAVILQ
jgi:hypothetical protein